MKIRGYSSDDQNDILSLFNGNSPKYFALEERTDLIFYLENDLEDSFVLEVDSKIVASGGINYSLEHASISWDFVHPDEQGKGYGSVLLKYRIDVIKTKLPLKLIKVRTSQLAFGFYQKLGFEIISTKKDYWAKGYDLVEMNFKESSIEK